MKVCFVGTYNEEFNAANAADSPAANQVQLKLIEELIRKYGEDVVCTLSFKPQQSWPNGPLVVRTKRQKNGVSFGYLNIPFFKTILSSLKLFGFLYKNEIDIVMKYNISLNDALVLSILKHIKKNIFICVVIQDVDYPHRGLKMVQGLFGWCAVRLCAGFDFNVPITASIVNDFNLPISKAFVFNGGITRQTEAIITSSDFLQDNLPIEDFAVFAGALEKYNGTDILIKEWIRSNIPIKLHIFGKGALSNIVSDAASVYDTVIYHGFVSEKEVNSWQILSRFNICLRYSKDMNENYFFPSKFFNIVAAQGFIIVNNFSNLPEGLKPFCSIVEEDLGNLGSILKDRDITEQSSNYLKRLDWLYRNCQWSFVVDESNERYIKSKKPFYN